jgi:hypothetical protein
VTGLHKTIKVYKERRLAGRRKKGRRTLPAKAASAIKFFGVSLCPEEKRLAVEARGGVKNFLPAVIIIAFLEINLSLQLIALSWK